MLQDDPWSNPGHLEADRGEALWRKRRGPRNASLEACDLGRGPGRVEGAFAELPRYFRDADRVMDLEARLVWCMETLQGFARADIVERPYSKANQPAPRLRRSPPTSPAGRADSPSHQSSITPGSARR